MGKIWLDYFCGCAGCVRMDDHAMTLLLLEIQSPHPRFLLMAQLC